MKRPDSSEFAPYYGGYIALAADDVIGQLAAQTDEIRSTIDGLPEEKGRFAYAEGKWTIKEVLSHLIDGERIFSYRILRISRGDETPIEGFEQDSYIENSNANNRSFADLLDEFDRQRQANLLMINNIDEAGLGRIGTASGNPISARTLVFISAGHVEHHLRILKERYLT
jgi:hypothetical protein